MALIDDLNELHQTGDESRVVIKVLSHCGTIRGHVEGRKSDIDGLVAGGTFQSVPQSVKDEGQVVLDGIEQFKTFMAAHPEFFNWSPPE